MANFRKLHVWQLAHQLTLDLYRVTRRFPRDEQFGLTAQIRRASVSIPANLAEGSNQSSPSFARYVSMAIGSANELEYLLQLSNELGLPLHSTLSDRATQLAKMLQGLRSHLTTRGRSRRRTIED